VARAQDCVVGDAGDETTLVRAHRGEGLELSQRRLGNDDLLFVIDLSATDRNIRAGA
jgi:hypothetical protein